MKKFTVILILVMSMFMGGIAEATTLLDIRTSVRKYLFDNAPGLNSYQAFLNAQIDEAINQSQLFILDTLPASANYNLVKTASLTIVNGQQDYAVPANFRKIISLAYNDKPAIQVKPEEFYSKVKSASLGKDPMFTILDSKIRLFPTPTSGLTAEVMFMAQPIDLTTEASVLSTLPEHDRLITMASIYFLMLASNNPTYAATIEKIVMNIVQSKANWYFNSNVIEKPLTTPQPVPATK